MLFLREKNFFHKFLYDGSRLDTF